MWIWYSHPERKNKWPNIVKYKRLNLLVRKRILKSCKRIFIKKKIVNLFVILSQNDYYLPYDYSEIHLRIFPYPGQRTNIKNKSFVGDISWIPLSVFSAVPWRSRVLHECHLIIKTNWHLKKVYLIKELKNITWWHSLADSVSFEEILLIIGHCGWFKLMFTHFGKQRYYLIINIVIEI